MQQAHFAVQLHLCIAVRTGTLCSRHRGACCLLAADLKDVGNRVRYAKLSRVYAYSNAQAIRVFWVLAASLRFEPNTDQSMRFLPLQKLWLQCLAAAVLQRLTRACCE